MPKQPFMTPKHTVPSCLQIYIKKIVTTEDHENKLPSKENPQNCEEPQSNVYFVLYIQIKL